MGSNDRVPERLTVLGVLRRDPRIAVELGRFVPNSADAVYRLRSPVVTDPWTILGAAVSNPPAVVGALLVRSWRRFGVRDAVEAAIDAVVADEGLADERIEIQPLSSVTGQKLRWTVAGWLVTALFVAGVVGFVIVPSLVTGLFAVVGIGLSIAYGLAHAGANLRRRDEEILQAAVDRARERGHRHPVVIVPERHAPGIAEDAKDLGISANARAVSTELLADESLYPSE